MRNGAYGSRYRRVLYSLWASGYYDVNSGGGGLGGIMTFTNYFSRFFTGQASFKSQVIIAETTAVDKFDNAFRTLRNIILVTFSIESIGTLILFNRFNSYS